MYSYDKQIKGYGYIIGRIQSCYAWIILNENNKIFESTEFPTMIGYDIETNRLLNNEIGSLCFEEI